MSEEKKHAKYSPSSANRIIGCPASVKLSEGIPNISSKYAEEGTEAHIYFEKAMVNYGLGQEMIKFPDEGMQESIVSSVNFVHEATKHLGSSRSFKLEHPVKMKVIDEDCSGTCDLIVESPFNEIHIYDFKFGANKKVEVKDNAQMLSYAVGALTDDKGNWDESYEKIFIGVLQPRMDNMEVIEVSIEKLKAFAGRFKEAIFLAKLDCAPVEGKHCQFCPASRTCPAKHKAFFEVSVASFDKLEKAQEDEKLVHVLAQKKKVVKLLKDIEEHLLERLKKGEKIEGIRLGKGKKVKSWLGPAETAFHNIPYAWKRELIGVTALEKLLKKNKSEMTKEMLDDLVTITQHEKVELIKDDELEEYDLITE